MEQQVSTHKYSLQMKKYAHSIIWNWNILCNLVSIFAMIQHLQVTPKSKISMVSSVYQAIARGRGHHTMLHAALALTDLTLGYIIAKILLGWKFKSCISPSLQTWWWLAQEHKSIFPSLFTNMSLSRNKTKLFNENSTMAALRVILRKWGSAVPPQHI